MLLFLCAMVCRNEPATVDTGCEDAGNIDTVRYKMAGELCAWSIECGGYTMDYWENCYREALTELSRPVAVDEQCIDWCDARSYHQAVRSRDCDMYPADQADALAEVTGVFYACSEPNYERVTYEP